MKSKQAAAATVPEVDAEMSAAIKATNAQHDGRFWTGDCPICGAAERFRLWPAGQGKPGTYLAFCCTLRGELAEVPSLKPGDNEPTPPAKKKSVVRKRGKRPSVAVVGEGEPALHPVEDTVAEAVEPEGPPAPKAKKTPTTPTNKKPAVARRAAPRNIDSIAEADRVLVVRGMFAAHQRAVIERFNLADPLRIALIALSQWGESGDPSLSVLAARLGCTPRHVMRQLGTLKERGFLTWEGGKTTGRRNVYSLFLPPEDDSNL